MAAAKAALSLRSRMYSRFPHGSSAPGQSSMISRRSIEKATSKIYCDRRGVALLSEVEGARCSQHESFAWGMESLASPRERSGLGCSLDFGGNDGIVRRRGPNN